jgi:hypothetical protein
LTADLNYQAEKFVKLYQSYSKKSNIPKYQMESLQEGMLKHAETLNAKLYEGSGESYAASLKLAA